MQHSWRLKSNPYQGQHFHPHPQAPWVKLTVTLTLAPGGGGGNVDPWRPWDFLEALDGQLRCRRRFFFFQENDPHISGSPERPPTLPQAFFFVFPEKRPHILGSPPWALKAHRVQ